MKLISVLGICAGNGVCLLPFKRLGRFEILGNIEPRSVFYDKTDYQWSLNFPNIIKGRTINDVHERIRYSPGLQHPPDIIIGHPDCGHASILRLSRAKKNISAKDNESLNTYIQGVKTHQPKLFLMENLPGLLNTYSKEDFKDIFPEYNLIFHVSSVMAYGNSQKSRERLVIVGIRKNLKVNYKKLFRLPDYSDRAKTAEHFEIGDDMDQLFGHIREPLEKECNLILGDKKKITYSKARLVWLTKYKGLTKWPVGGKMKNQPGVNRMVSGKYPFTVRKQNRQFGIYGNVLSPREMAMIQGLPKSFRMDILPLGIDDKNLIYWINKWRVTVTKTMPYEIALWFARKSIRAFDSLSSITDTN